MTGKKILLTWKKMEKKNMLDLGCGESNPGLLSTLLRSESQRCYRYTTPDRVVCVSELLLSLVGTSTYQGRMLTLELEKHLLGKTHIPHRSTNNAWAIIADSLPPS